MTKFLEESNEIASNDQEIEKNSHKKKKSKKKKHSSPAPAGNDDEDFVVVEFLDSHPNAQWFYQN